MKTLKLQFNDADLTCAGKIIRSGGLVAFPTETVYGLGVNALDGEAVSKVFEAKGRPSDNPLIVHIYDVCQLAEIASEISDDARKVIDAFMPCSLTVVLPKKDVIPDSVTAGLQTVAVRMPESLQARTFLKYCNVPVAAPSANTSTRPSPTTWQTVAEDMDGKIEAILQGEPCNVGIESTVLDLTEEPRILRPGIVTPRQISAVLNKKVTVITDPKDKVNSPGVKYKHYAPSCDMYLNVDGDKGKLKAFYEQCVSQGKTPVLLVQNTEDYLGKNTYPLGKTDREVAQNIFSALRTLEKRYDVIIASYVGASEISIGILNRLTKSAAHRIL
ncbi:MAG: L-threonylcarbamoyladenylate synthase [Corallococcus sp.]|nr:L-threonylcarbamoyladenylate synthase [Corallococcus sp.]